MTRVARAMASRSTPPGLVDGDPQDAAGELEVVELEAEVGEQRARRGADALDRWSSSRSPPLGSSISSQTKGVGRAHASRSPRTQANRCSGPATLRRPTAAIGDGRVTRHRPRADAPARRRSVGLGDDGDEVGLVVAGGQRAVGPLQAADGDAAGPQRGLALARPAPPTGCGRTRRRPPRRLVDGGDVDGAGVAPLGGLGQQVGLDLARAAPGRPRPRRARGTAALSPCRGGPG